MKVKNAVLVGVDGEVAIPNPDTAEKIGQLVYEPIGEFSDGYHSFNELYEFRMLYNAAFFNLLAQSDPGANVHKSKRHSDNTIPFGGGWFVVVAHLPSGQITNHYELKDWDLFQIPERAMAAPYDGHSPQEVAGRIRNYLQQS